MRSNFFSRIKKKLTRPTAVDFIGKATDVTLQLTSVDNTHADDEEFSPQKKIATLWVNNNKKALSDNYLTLHRLFKELAETKVTKLHIIVEIFNSGTQSCFNNDLGRELCNLPTNIKTLFLSIPELYLLPTCGELSYLEELSITGNNHRSLSLINRCPQLKKLHLSNYTLLAINHELDTLCMNTPHLDKIHIDKVTSNSLAHAEYFCKNILNYKAQIEITFKEVDANESDAAATTEILNNFSKLSIIRRSKPALTDEVVNIITKKLI